MDALQELLEKDAIRRVKARYCRLLDEKAWDEWAALFAEDASMTTGGGTVAGRAEIQKMVQGAMQGIPSSHQTFNAEIDLLDWETATAIWGAMFIQSKGRTTGVGYYYDTLRKVDDQWLLSSVDLRTSFVEGSALQSELVGE